jgi:hypothetical protein
MQARAIPVNLYLYEGLVWAPAQPTWPNVNGFTPTLPFQKPDNVSTALWDQRMSFTQPAEMLVQDPTTNLKNRVINQYMSQVGIPWFNSFARQDEFFWLTVFGSPGAPVAPATPANPAAVAQTSSSVLVTWSASTGATSYPVRRAPDAGGVPGAWGAPVSVGTGVPLDTAMLDTGLSAGTTYWYQVAAANGTGTSAYGAAVGATTPTPGASPVLRSGYPVSAYLDNITGRTVASPTITPPAATMLYVLVMGGGAARDVPSVAGGGLTWTRAVQRATSQGVAAAYTAVTGASPGSFAVTATLDVADARSIVVYAFDGATTSSGATASASTTSGRLATSIVPQASNSVLLCAASNCMNSSSFGVSAGTTADFNRPLPAFGNAQLACRSNGTVVAGQAYSLGSSSPTNADGNVIAIEVLAR